MPTTIRIPLTNSAKLSARTTPKLTRLWPQSMTEAAAAPARPMSAEHAERQPLVLAAEGLDGEGDQRRRDDDEDRDDGLEFGEVHGCAPPLAAPCGASAAAAAGGALGCRGPVLAAGDPLDHGPDGGLGGSEEDGREHAHHDGHRHRRAERRPLARRQVGQRRVLRVGDLAVVHALEHPEHVDGRQDDAGRRHRGQLAAASGSAPSRSGTRRRSRSGRAGRSTTA